MQESGEMYLETILLLKREKSKLRAVDISKKMELSKPSVSRALGKLKADAYITVDEVDVIELTAKGQELAEKIYERHEVLSSVLKKLGVSDETADADACKIEHDISDETFEAIKKYIEENL